MELRHKKKYVNQLETDISDNRKVKQWAGADL
jgi:hypothetical protein